VEYLTVFMNFSCTHIYSVSYFVH